MRWLTLRVFRLTFLSLVIFDMACYLLCNRSTNSSVLYCEIGYGALPSHPDFLRFYGTGIVRVVGLLER